MHKGLGLEKSGKEKIGISAQNQAKSFYSWSGLSGLEGVLLPTYASRETAVGEGLSPRSPHMQKRTSARDLAESCGGHGIRRRLTAETE